MRKLVLSYILILICLLSNGQNTAVYNWQEHLSYQNAKKVINTSNHIFCSTKNGVFSYDKENYYLTKLNKISGLSDVSVSELSYDEFTKCLIIAYENCNVDLVSENEVTNISDIKDKLILGQKKINDISIYNNTAYISTTFGIVLLDLEKEEIKETYNLYENGLPLKINECKINDTSIFAATNNGCYYADINSSQLFDFNSWKKIDGSTGDIKNIVFNSYGIVTNENGQNNFIDQDNNITFGALDDQLFYYLNDSSALSTISDSNFNYIQDAKFDQEQNIWIADSASSLIKFTNESFSEIIKPSGPSYNYAEKITLNDHKLFMIHNQNKNSISWSEDLLQWNMKNNIINATCVNSIGNDYYYGTSSKGLIQEDNQSNIIQLNLNNTNNILDSNSKIVDLKIDASGVLWGTETNSSNPLFCKDQENNWHSFIMPFVASSTSNIGEMIIDNYNQKWGIIYGSGIFVYNDNGTLENKEDDQFTKLTTAVGSGNLPDKNVYCMANDLEGDVWVGTKSGICVFYSPSSIFSGYNYDAQQIIVEENGFGQYLLESDIIYTIKIDGANRKWVGTLGSGVYLLSADGREEIFHFTVDNSPLISNTIIDIELNNITSEVHILTDKGLMTFRGDAISGSKEARTLKVFPNPVREDYIGDIAIENLAYNSEVKITDVNGNIVYQTRSNGGMAIWNGRDENNEKVATGVYLIFAANNNKKGKALGKILIIR